MDAVGEGAYILSADQRAKDQSATHQLDNFISSNKLLPKITKENRNKLGNFGFKLPTLKKIIV